MDQGIKNIIYKRVVEDRLKKLLFKGKIVILYGARQVGKTTLVKKLVKEYDGAYFLCEEPDVNEALTNKTSTEMKAFLGNKKFIVLDEAQKIHNIGTSLKLLIDVYPEIQIIATGSSSFDLANKINEPLTGRNYEILMYPLSIEELISSYSETETRRLLSQYMVYGTYPGVLNAGELRQENIKKITNDYLYKDLLGYHGIRKPELLQKILRALAFQVGNQVSYTEIAGAVGANRETVRSYIDILEKAFIVFRLFPLHKNKRDEIKSQQKIFFYDNGVLNTLLQNYNSIDSRDDVGKLFENFFISEKIKQKNNHNINNSVYFWRKQKSGEVDFIEIVNNVVSSAFECKYSKAKIKIPRVFKDTYNPKNFIVITKDNLINHFSN